MLNHNKIIAGIQSLFQPKYPYSYKVKFLNNIYRFCINSPVEDFRIRDWGAEKEYTIDILQKLSNNDILYDVGASVGLVTILAAKRVSKGSVVSFEPDNTVFGRLLKNIEMNGLRNIKPLKYALGNVDGNTMLYTKGADNFSPRLTNSHNLRYSHKIPIRKIDTLLDQKIIPYPNLLKIDVEGAEKDVLFGMKGLLKSRKKPKMIFLEIHPDLIKQFKSSVKEVIDFLFRYDYKIVYIKKVHNQLLCCFSIN